MVLSLLQIGFMASDKHPSKKRIRPPQTVELHYSKKTFDVNAWLGKYTERAVDLEVHALADRVPPSDALVQPTSKPIAPQNIEAPDSIK